MRDVAIVGAGMTKFGRAPGDLMDILAEASMRAIKHAKADKEEFDALYVSNMMAGETSHQTAVASSLADRLALVPAAADRIENGPASGGSAIKNGFLAVASGACDMVLVAGGEKMTTADGDVTTDLISTMTHPTAEYIHGVTLPAMAGMLARVYMERFGVTERHLGLIAVKNHANAVKNPYAHIQRACTVEGTMQSGMVADPLRLYHVCPVSDGSAALVLCSMEKAKKFTDKPVRIAGFGQATDVQSLQEREDPAVLKSVQIAAKRAFKMSGKTTEDIDVAELHDAFEILEIAEAEDIGFFEKGKGHLAMEKGETALNGRLPINTSGGLKARGHAVGATGVAQAVELVWQLRGECGERQVKDAKTALSCNFGGFGNNTVIHVFERGW